MNAKKDSLNLVLANRALEISKIKKTDLIEKKIAMELKKIGYEEKFIRAPFNGTIVEVNAKQHEYYSAGTKVIEFANLSQLTTEIHVSKKDLIRVLKNKPEITVSREGRSIRAVVDSHNPIAQPGVEVFLVKLKFTNKYGWSPGTVLKVHF